MGNKFSRKKSKENLYKKGIGKTIYPRPIHYDMKIPKVKAVFKDYNGHESKPKFSYMYKGVPGGWYV
tara:strand:- start:3 stop:203 length:201 start_codon:yes stop_codon:yes gene_type:complete